ncbi:hypothetical protein CFIO01_01392 [Colletotrichum fioriniae PJ7]|uniref:Uncharacterized protein n=1 Tax=Colletotrichum fioriniae PJ7 TaxID=1445577 RepID=A0A010RRQ5_9PEZI|nr:hypothetical protein CFIO01_01392 [Colletotrichum fioriniae PJ7]
MNAVAEPAGLFGAMVPVFGVATVGLPAARLRGPRPQEAAMTGQFRECLGSYWAAGLWSPPSEALDQWQQRIRGLNRGWRYSMEENFWAGMEGCPGAHGTATVDDGPSAVGRAVRPLGDRRDPTFNLFTRARVPYPAPRQPGYCLSISTSTSLLSIVIVRTLDMGKEEINAPLPPHGHARAAGTPHGAKTFDLRSPMFLFGP